MNILKMTEQIFFKLRKTIETAVTDVLPVYMQPKICKFQRPAASLTCI